MQKYTGKIYGLIRFHKGEENTCILLLLLVLMAVCLIKLCGPLVQIMQILYFQIPYTNLHKVKENTTKTALIWV